MRLLPTLMLLLWSAGLAVSAALICYALATGVEATLFASGVVFAVSLWWGPGGSRVRGPVSRVVQPLSRTTGTWLAAVVTLAALTAALALHISSGGVSWAPGDERPFADGTPSSSLSGR